MSVVVLNSYRLERTIGEGPVGIVYRGRIVDTHQAVAVKEVHRNRGWTPSIGAQCAKAVAAASRVRHPDVARLHALAQEGGRTLIVTDWVDGESLAELLTWSGGRMDPNRALELFVNVLAALEQAHACGLVHGNLKPENLLIPRGGGLQRSSVVDFGVGAVLADSGAGRDGQGLLPNLVFRAPEHIIDPRALSAAADLYAVGCMLYVVLSGQSPFRAADDRALVKAHLTEAPVPLRTRAPELAQEFETIVHQALQKNPARRPASAALMRQALIALLPAPRRQALNTASAPPDASLNPTFQMFGAPLPPVRLQRVQRPPQTPTRKTEAPLTAVVGPPAGRSRFAEARDVGSVVAAAIGAGVALASLPRPLPASTLARASGRRPGASALAEAAAAPVRERLPSPFAPTFETLAAVGGAETPGSGAAHPGTPQPIDHRAPTQLSAPVDDMLVASWAAAQAAAASQAALGREAMASPVGTPAAPALAATPYPPPLHPPPLPAPPSAPSVLGPPAPVADPPGAPGFDGDAGPAAVPPEPAPPAPPVLVAAKRKRRAAVWLVLTCLLLSGCLALLLALLLGGPD